MTMVEARTHALAAHLVLGYQNEQMCWFVSASAPRSRLLTRADVPVAIGFACYSSTRGGMMQRNDRGRSSPTASRLNIATPSLETAFLH